MNTMQRASSERGTEAPERRTLWHGRFEGGPADELLAFTVSLDFDRRLAADDLPGSRAHVRGLARAGILDGDEAERRPRRPRPGRGRAAAGTFAFDPTDEDIHTAIERRVTELAGPAGAKLHTGRSRNDQVATDLRLWTKRELADVARRVAGPAADAARAGHRRRRRLPAGLHPPAAGPAGAAGPPPAGPRLGAGPRRRPAARLPAPPRRVAAGGGGAGRVVAAARPRRHRRRPRVRGPLREQPRRRERPGLRGRGAVRAERCSAIHLSRMGEEVVLWSTDEFGFARLDDAYATGLVDAAPEEEPRHRRAGPGQGRPA